MHPTIHKARPGTASAIGQCLDTPQVSLDRAEQEARIQHTLGIKSSRVRVREQIWDRRLRASISNRIVRIEMFLQPDAALPLVCS